MILEWDKTGERYYEAGIDRGVMYPPTSAHTGVPWNGLISIEETPDGGEIQPIYYDGNKIVDIVSYEDYSAVITALSPPSADFVEVDGGRTLAPGLEAKGQPRKTFGLTYRTKIGNDTEGTDLGYKLHLVYNLTASPASISNKTDDTNQNYIEYKWTVNAVPEPSSTFKPTAHLVIDSTKADPDGLSWVEKHLYGDTYEMFLPELPTQATVIALLT